MKNFIERLEDLKYNAKFDVISSYENGYNRGINESISIYNELHPQTKTIAPEPNKPHTERSFKVMITKADNLRWYRDYIGKDFEVEIDDEFNYKMIKSVNGYRYILKSDCEIIPETTVIAFDYKRWKDGDYVRVVTRDGREVKQLTFFELVCEYPFVGVIADKRESWTLEGGYSPYFSVSDKDLFLEISKPKPKQVTTYHYIGLNGQVKGVIDEFSVKSIGETVTEQQPDGSFKIISTTLK